MKHVIYLRVSTDQQAESGLGLEAQERCCIEYALKSSSEYIIFKDEGISGSAKLDKREGLISAINCLVKGDALLVAKRDRLVRGNILLLAMIEAAVERKGACVVSVAGEGTENDDPSSVLMRRMIDAFSEYERMIISQRTKAALGVKKSKNEISGHIPYGKKLSEDGVHLENCAEEIEIINEVIEMRKFPKKTIAEIMANLNLQGKFNRGKPWSIMAVHRLIAKHVNSKRCK